MRVGIIGLGKRGKTHFRFYQNIDMLKVVAICDPTIDNTNIYRSDGIVHYKAYTDMLQEASLDMVSICTPPYFHYKISMDCINSGVHCLVEKPMTLCTSDAKSLSLLAEQKGIVLMPGYNYLFDSKIQKIKEVIASGELGDTSIIRASQSHNWGGKGPFSWHTNKKLSGGGTLMDNCSHYLSILEFLFGDIQKVSAFSTNNSFHLNVEDSAIIMLSFGNGAIGVVESSWNNSEGRSNELSITGSKATLKLKDTNYEQILEVNKYLTEENEWNRIVKERIYLPKGVEQLSKKRNIDNSKSLLKENTENLLEYFISTIRNDKRPKEYIANAIRTHELINYAYSSIEENKSLSTI